MLSPAARIAVVAPAGAFAPDRLEAGMATLRGWGYRPVEAPNLRASFRYTAGTTAERASDLHWALTAPDLDAVWFARGGYGTFSAMATLPWDRIDARPVFGFSDATALLVAMHRRGLNGVHAPVLQNLAAIDPATAPGAVLSDAESLTALRDLLTGRGPTPMPGRLLCGPNSSVRGPVLGGNLAVLTSLCGTAEALDSRGAIVVLEDLGEAPYRIDRLLTQLMAAGSLDGALGIALGEFHGCEPPLRPGAPPLTWQLTDVLNDLLEPLGIPVVTGLPIGHGARNFAFQFGARAQLDATGLTWPR